MVFFSSFLTIESMTVWSYGGVAVNGFYSVLWDYIGIVFNNFNGLCILDP